MFKRWRVVFGILFFLIVSVGLFYWWFIRQERLQRENLLRPLARLGYVALSNTVETNKQYRVMGYLPYWNMNTASISGRLDDVAYFAVSLGADGTITERTSDGTEPGFSRLQRDDFSDWMAEQHAAGRRVHLTVTGGSADELSALFTSQTNRTRAINSLTQLMLSYPFDSLQLDFEYAGTVTDQLRAGYVSFAKETDQSLQELNPQLEITVAAFASAGSKYTFWDIAGLEPYVDGFVVMAYDYHLRSSAVTGPVAPIFGRQAGRWDDDIVTNLRGYLQNVPPEKILLGIPFYGYEWTATSDQPGANTYPETGATATYKRVRELLDDAQAGAQERWDEDALAPYVVYEENGRTQVIYYEDTRSLGYKLDLVKQLGLQGIAVWALGYEGEYSELWEVISQKLPQN